MIFFALPSLLLMAMPFLIITQCSSSRNLILERTPLFYDKANFRIWLLKIESLPELITSSNMA